MSWSVASQGRAGAVADQIREQFSRITCAEPEETIKNGVAAAIGKALEAFPQNMAVRVNANGSQGCPDFNKPAESYHSLNVAIEPMHGFVGL